MKPNRFVILAPPLLVTPGAHADRKKDREGGQARLNQACEVAREKKRAPLRQRG